MDPHDSVDDHESGDGDDEIGDDVEKIGDENDEIGDDVEEIDVSIDGSSARGEVDQRIVDVLSWILDTETRAKIYVFLLANPGSTSEEVAKGTGLYPSTVREALAELHDEERVSREKRESEGAGNNPYEYTAIQPSELVAGTVDQIQHELNTIFTLDRLLDRGDREERIDEDVEPVTITVEDTSEESEDVDDSLDDIDDSTEDVDDGTDDLDDESLEVDSDDEREAHEDRDDADSSDE